MTADYQADAEQAVAETAAVINSPDTGYHGEHPLGKTWAITFSVHRDSDTLEKSNFEAISTNLQKRFPKSTDVEHFRHWGVGWIDHLVVRMLDRQGKVTKAGKAALDYKYALEDYPVIDDADYSRREYEESIESLQNWGLGLSEEDAQRVFGWLGNHGRDYSPEGMHDKDVQEAVQAIRYEDVLKTGIPKPIVDLGFTYMNTAGMNTKDTDDIEQAFTAIAQLRSVLNLSVNDISKVIKWMIDKEEDLLNPDIVKYAVTEMQLQPEDVATLPLFPGLQGLRRR